MNLFHNVSYKQSFPNENRSISHTQYTLIFLDTDMKSMVRAALNKIEAVTCIRFKEYPMGQAPGHFVRIISSDKGLIVFFTVTLATQSADIPL